MGIRDGFSNNKLLDDFGCDRDTPTPGSRPVDRSDLSSSKNSSSGDRDTPTPGPRPVDRSDLSPPKNSSSGDRDRPTPGPRPVDSSNLSPPKNSSSVGYRNLSTSNATINIIVIATIKTDWIVVFTRTTLSRTNDIRTTTDKVNDITTSHDDEETRDPQTSRGPEDKEAVLAGHENVVHLLRWIPFKWSRYDYDWSSTSNVAIIEDHRTTTSNGQDMTTIGLQPAT
uniref:Uncharacterized protein n=1 Tax=Oryza sativa subsp. japonica TaxID=39947 RepID=Q2QRZ8_ORYSJ|nr:hypothetical protein LOC_Os12g25840 [Oryza sativa Japonica Group]